jgi:hypothetical protein
MAARLNPRHQGMVREKIKTSQLVNRLTDHALGLLKKPMDATQITAAKVILDKSLPNLSSVEMAMEVNAAKPREQLLRELKQLEKSMGINVIEGELVGTEPTIN